MSFEAVVVQQLFNGLSLGMMYDSKRNIFWAVDTDSHVYVLRLDRKAADVQAMP